MIAGTSGGGFSGAGNESRPWVTPAEALVRTAATRISMLA